MTGKLCQWQSDGSSCVVESIESQTTPSACRRTASGAGEMLCFCALTRSHRVIVIVCSTFCFLCAHLAAHRGNVQGRNSDYRNIRDKITFRAETGPAKCVRRDYSNFKQTTACISAQNAGIRANSARNLGVIVRRNCTARHPLAARQYTPHGPYVLR